MHIHLYILNKIYLITKFKIRYFLLDYGLYSSFKVLAFCPLTKIHISSLIGSTDSNGNLLQHIFSQFRGDRLLSKLGNFLRGGIVSLTSNPIQSPSTISRGYCGPILLPCPQGNTNISLGYKTQGKTFKISISNNSQYFFF